MQQLLVHLKAAVQPHVSFILQKICLHLSGLRSTIIFCSVARNVRSLFYGSPLTYLNLLNNLYVETSCFTISDVGVRWYCFQLSVYKLSEASPIFQIWLDCHTVIMGTSLCESLVEVCMFSLCVCCVCVCPDHNLKKPINYCRYLLSAW